MAKQVWNNPIDKHTDWGGDPVKTDGLPVSGEMVQKFIKDTLEGKAGLFHYDATNNRYLVFADADARDEYLADPNKTELIIGTFDAPFNYTAEISLTSAVYNAVFLGSAGNYIDFTFDIKNKQGASTGENVTVTYTFIRNATRQVVKETRKYGDAVHFNVDKYLGEGTNTVIVGITGQTSLAATTVAITYQVVNLVLTDKYDISKSYNLSSGSKKVEVPFTVSGYGTKIVEWYLDGVRIPFVKAEDEIVDVSVDRTKYIEIANLQQGTHSLQFRAYTVVNGEQFFTDTLYRDIMVYTGADSNVILGVAVTVPRQYGVLGANDHVAIYDMVQYVPYTLRFATYSPSNAANTEVVVSIDGKEMGRVGSVNNVENRFVITPSTAGTKTLKLSALNVSKEYQAVIKETDMDINEIDSGLVLNFTAEGKTYNSPDRGYWTDGVHNAVLSGFNWNATSGWWNGRLEMSAGSSIQFDYAPLSGDPTNTGKTIEIEWSTKNVTNDDAVICDLRGDDGVGILITATKVSVKSADGVVVETEYKSDENVRIGFVINQASGTTNQRLSFIYANGIVSRGEKWAQADSYTSDKLMKFTATEEAEVSLKSIRIYDTALTSDNMLNNYILYRDTVSQMLDVYDRNDVYEEGTTSFSPDKMMGRLPVMIVTGDIPVLENTSDKDTQIVVDIEYHNMQDTSKSFTMKNAAMRPQGTSSMGYPKKNFRIYTQKVENTEVYDADGKLIEDKLYSFKKGAQPVNCWCLKADYAESSGTHNTGIARLWNEALMNAQIEGEYVCRTGAQKAALAAKYEYDVRTTIDGFPILLFYRPSANDDVIFIGKYNFNNDKSTESVFGFTGIPGFDNTSMQCWEVLNNGNPLALFTTVANFDRDWAEAFESRYPDTKTPYTGDLKAFCQWMVNVSQANFATEKWQHLNVYMMAAYWCYLMRHAAADQFVKNAMFTSEDGQHFYYILYDNDTINGLINTGRLRIKPTDDRQTVDETGSYVFAGHDSRLWNMLENDEEFISIVSAVDNALYSAGISYANTIKIFDEEQADKWVERVYNQDAQYKYVGPYVEKGIDNLFMLQGKRDLHRRWWLAKRFSIYDAKYVSGTYKSQAIEIKCLNGTEAGQKFSIVAGYPLDYGYGINNIPRDFGVSLEIGDAYEFTTKEVVNLGDPVRIYGAPNIAEIDFSKMSDRLAVVTIANVYDENLGTKLAKLVLGNVSKANYEVTEISGLKQAEALEYLDVQGMAKINSIDLSNHKYFKTLKAFGSGISSVAFAKGAPVERVEFPATMRVLSLEQLPYLSSDNVVLENIANLSGITIVSCPSISKGFDFINTWIENKTTLDSQCTLVMDDVDWEGVTGAQMTRIALLGKVSLKGKVKLTDLTEEQGEILMSVFGDSVFNENSEFFIDAPTTLTISGQPSLLEGEGTTYTAKVYPTKDGTIRFSLPTTRTGCSINPTTGVLTTTENGLATSNIVVRATFTPSNGDPALTKDMSVSVIKRTYPSNITISGNGNLLENTSFAWSTDTQGINGNYTVEWVLEGAIASYYGVESSGDTCRLVMSTSPTDTTQGKLVVKIIRNVDKVVMSTASISVYHTLSSLTISINSNQSNDATIAATKASVKYEDKTIYASNGQVVKIPIGVSVTVIFPEVTGYTRPDSQSYVSTYDSKSISVTYNTTIVKVTMSDNQTSLDDIAGVKATVKYDSTSTQVTSGGSVKVPFGKTGTVTWASVSGYKTPAQQSFTANEASLTYNGEYQTSIVTVSVVTNQSTHTDVASASITAKGTTVSATLTTGKTVKVPYGESVKFTGAAVNGYTTPSAVTYVGADASKTVTLTYSTTVVTVKMADNQTAYNDIANATASVAASGMTTVSVKNNGTAKVPTGASCTITWSAVSGYKTPDKQTFTTSGTSVSKTGTYQTEILTVTVTSDVDLPASYTITVSGIGSQTTASKVYKVPFGTSYTVSASAADEYKTPDAQTFTASQVSRAVSVVYLEYVIPPGVYIQHVNGALYTESEWAAGGYANSDANGVAIVSETVPAFVIAKEDASSSRVKWGGYDKTVPDIVTSNSSSTVVLDYDGAGNTPKIIEYLAGTNDGYVDGAPAAEACAAFTFPNGKKGYLPALGEWETAYNNKTTVKSAMTLIGGAAIQTNYYWSSTQYNRGYSWALSWTNGELHGYGKYYSNYVRAFAAL